MPPSTDDAVFPEMEAAAKQAEDEFNANPAPPEADAPTELRELFQSEADRNHKTHRYMRVAAFIVLGALIAAFLIVLLLVLLNLLSSEFLSVLVKGGATMNWHILVFAGAALAVFAAVPLSLAMALVKMISVEQNCDADGNYKTPTTELGKVILDLIKSVAQAAKSN